MSQHELARHYVLEVLGEKEERATLREAVNALWEHVPHFGKPVRIRSASTVLCSCQRPGREADRGRMALVEPELYLRARQGLSAGGGGIGVVAAPSGTAAWVRGGADPGLLPGGVPPAGGRPCSSKCATSRCTSSSWSSCRRGSGMVKRSPL